MVRSLKSDSSGDLDRRVFDPVRRKRVHLGPEEGVRQAILVFLVQDLNIPIGLIAVEMDIGDPQATFRADIVVHDRMGKPWMVVECKAPEVRISQDTFDQVSRYNRRLGAPYLLVSNGSMQYCCGQDASTGDLTYLEQMPDYPRAEGGDTDTLCEMDHV